ncbi:MAG TPA: glycosyl hydrolase family 28-related protein [Armatimonadota bacterium]|nr:glycosyl hydrolase family 28-related protein [Armatimonadota bacterium]
MRTERGWMSRMLGLTLAALLLASRAHGVPVTGDEFVGPFPSWANVKPDYGAVGDGKADDTAAIQKALEDVRRKDSPKRALFFPAGVYRITHTLKLERISHNEPLGMSITGEDPVNTIITGNPPRPGVRRRRCRIT